MAGDDRTGRFLYYAAFVLVGVGLVLRFAWPQGEAGAIAGYALTLVAIVICVVLARRAKR